MKIAPTAIPIHTMPVPIPAKDTMGVLLLIPPLLFAAVIVVAGEELTDACIDETSFCICFKAVLISTFGVYCSGNPALDLA